MSLRIKNLSSKQWEQIHALLSNPEEDLPVKRLQIVLRSATGEDVPVIAKAVNLHPINVRKWIHRYMTSGVDGLRSGKSPGRPSLFSPEQRASIVRVAKSNPRRLGQPFSRWSLKRLHRYFIDKRIVTGISLETIRQIITSEGAKYDHRRAD